MLHSVRNDFNTDIYYDVRFYRFLIAVTFIKQTKKYFEVKL